MDINPQTSAGIAGRQLVPALLRRSVRLGPLAVLILVAAAPGALGAQPASVAGSVVLNVWQAGDDGGIAPAAGVDVLLVKGLDQQVQRTKTDADGRFVAVVPPGGYSVALLRPGFGWVGYRLCGATAWQRSLPHSLNGPRQPLVDTSLYVRPDETECREYLLSETVPIARATPGAVYFTLDDGYFNLCETVDLLLRIDLPVTFFANGEPMLAHSDCVRRLLVGGSRLGNHTFAHEYLTLLPPAAIRETLQANEDVAVAVAGASTKPLCRAPYTALSPLVVQTAADWGCWMVTWDIDSGDSADATPEEIERRILSATCTGEVIILHTRAFPALEQILPRAVDALKARGCTPLPLEGG
jgi:peptidoglycan/xylan/chitin deacetylase (PgdA/CDA1 family)